MPTPTKKKAIAKPRYLDIPFPVHRRISIPSSEQIPRTCPECDYGFAWNKQNAGIFVNCCYCFYQFETQHTKVFRQIAKMQSLIGDQYKEYIPSDWHKLTASELEALAVNLATAIADLENDDEWTDL